MLTETGARRALLRTTERISCTLSDRVLCVSHSLREAAIREGLVTPERIRVLAGGSGNGVDARGRFDPARSPPAARRAFRRELGIEEDAPVVGFVGRLVRDKGIVELVDAWRRVVACHPAARLVVVGDFEERDAVPDAIRRALLEDPTIRTVGFRPDIERCYSAFDVVVLPTHREGFPNVLLEAGAMALPVVATRIPGCVDAVVPGVTGTLVPPGEGVALAEALERYLSDRGLAVQHGQAARRRILEEFEPPRIWAALADVYAELLREAGRETPARPEEDRSREGSG